jgi:hypothetical protein
MVFHSMPSSDEWYAWHRSLPVQAEEPVPINSKSVALVGVYLSRSTTLHGALIDNETGTLSRPDISLMLQQVMRYLSRCEITAFCTSKDPHVALKA